jgi:hypothetical protein
MTPLGGRRGPRLNPSPRRGPCRRLPSTGALSGWWSHESYPLPHQPKAEFRGAVSLVLRHPIIATCMLDPDNFPIPKVKNTPRHNPKKPISGAGREGPPQNNTFMTLVVAPGHQVMHHDFMRYAMTLRMDDPAWSKLLHESRRTGIQPGPLARSYVLAALESVELPPQDPPPAARRSATKRNTEQQKEPLDSLPDDLLPPSVPKTRRGGATRAERRSNKEDG